jgi:hypothetical protein
MQKIDIQNQFPIIKHEYVQIQIPAGSTNTRLYFPELPNLRNVHVLNIESTNATIIPFSPDNSAVINQPLFYNTFLTLIDYRGKEFIHQIPLVHLLYVTGAGHYEQLIKKLVGQRVSWTKSYIEFSSSANVSGTTLEVVPFSVYYADVKSEEMKDARSSFTRQS